MKFLLVILTIFFSMFSHRAFPQKHLILDGDIKFEKTVNITALIRKLQQSTIDPSYKLLLEKFKNDHPQFIKSYSNLFFSEEKSLFKPENETISTIPDALIDQNNIIFTNFNSRTAIDEKNVFGKKFLIKEPAKLINWKITAERRVIAGINCRRANAVVDSIYVVAFYSDQIPIPGGPESFNGLPGIILGLVLPHENISWFAVSVTETSNLRKQISAPTEGQKMNLESVKQFILSNKKNWGLYGQNALKGLLL